MLVCDLETEDGLPQVVDVLRTAKWLDRPVRGDILSVIHVFCVWFHLLEANEGVGGHRIRSVYKIDGELQGAGFGRLEALPATIRDLEQQQERGSNKPRGRPVS